MPRKYELKQRAEAIEETRHRIVEATVQLHQELGPAATSVVAIAERAGVGRVTVYRHFPDEDRLLEACRDMWIGANPLPDLEPWSTIRDPKARLRKALTGLYLYYGRTHAMWEKVLRDADEMPDLVEVLSGYVGYLESLERLLATGWKLPTTKQRSLGVVLGFVLNFWSWRSLSKDQGLGDKKAATLAAELVERWIG